ncbi:MAG: hypothetical protein JO048_14505 [Methylobacteriaceae bacterium]|nr:hypothetical protein [Methylobacteriaceae bacterium]
MSTRDHNNRSEKQKGHAPVQAGEPPATAHGGQHGDHEGRDRSGTDSRQDGKSRQNGGGDGAGGAPKAQGQGQANKGVDNHHENRGHG